MEQVLGLVKGGQSGDGGKMLFLFFFDVFVSLAGGFLLSSQGMLKLGGESANFGFSAI